MSRCATCTQTTRPTAPQRKSHAATILASACPPKNSVHAQQRKRCGINSLSSRTRHCSREPCKNLVQTLTRANPQHLTRLHQRVDRRQAMATCDRCKVLADAVRSRRYRFHRAHHRSRAAEKLLVVESTQLRQVSSMQSANAIEISTQYPVGVLTLKVGAASRGGLHRPATHRPLMEGRKDIIALATILSDGEPAFSLICDDGLYLKTRAVNAFGAR